MATHPLQIALDRSSRALRTVTDLIEIAHSRKAPNGRSDARQASLYRAVVTASVGVVEEATEALVTEAIRAQGVQPKGMTFIESTIARLMQNPNSSEVQKIMQAFVGFDPIPGFTVTLRTSAPAYRDPTTASGGRTSYNLWTIYNQDRTWKGREAAEVLDRFVKIRHSFAHQDSSVILFTKPETNLMRNKLCNAKAATPADIAFVERLNATCATQVLTPTAGNDDPVNSWRLHETHALNAFLTASGIVASMGDSLADFLETEAGLARASHDPLTLEVETGSWIKLAGTSLSTSPSGVPWTLVPYKPNSRD